MTGISMHIPDDDEVFLARTGNLAEMFYSRTLEACDEDEEDDSWLDSEY